MKAESPLSAGTGKGFVYQKRISGGYSACRIIFWTIYIKEGIRPLYPAVHFRSSDLEIRGPKILRGLADMSRLSRNSEKPFSTCFSLKRCKALYIKSK
jgi:hypothetical protein